MLSVKQDYQQNLFIKSQSLDVDERPLAVEIKAGTDIPGFFTHDALCGCFPFVCSWYVGGLFLPV